MITSSAWVLSTWGARDYERASQTFSRATEVDPTNARAWVELAGAEDGAYQYVAADRDYLHARACPERHRGA